MRSTHWDLAPCAHAAVHQDDLVILDIATDSYLCLPGAGGAVRLGPDRCSLEIADPRISAELSAAGLLFARPAPPNGLARSRASVARPVSSAVRLAYPLPTWRDLGEALPTLLDLLGGYWRRPFAEVLQGGVAKRPDVAGTPTLEMLRAVDAFQHWIPYAPVPAKCLLRSFLLLRWLARRGLGAHWVFGVMTWPFRAHCWLQCGDVVLDDEAERVAAYAVILVL